MAEEVKRNSVAAKSALVESMEAGWDLANALLSGTDGMRKQSSRYLPKWPNEETKSYNTRLSVSTLYPAFEQTVTVLAAKPFSKAPTISDKLDPRITELLDDFDLQGRTVAEVGHDLMVLAMGPGLAGIHIDFKRNPTPGQTTVAEEKALGLRPYAVIIRPEQLRGWRSTVANGQHTLTMVRFMEEVEEPDGQWGTACVQQIRVLEPGKWSTFRRSANPVAPGADDWIPHENGTTTLQEVPFTFVYGKRLGFGVGVPPLKELAHLNIKHWQSQSDQDTLLHVARVPILVTVGVESSAEKPFELTIGASATVNLPREASLEYVEHTGQAIGAGKTALDDLKDEMRQAGAELLVLGPTPNTRIDAAADDSKSTCVVQRIAQALEDSLDEAIEYLHKWLGIEKPEGHCIKLFEDYGAANLSDASASLLVGMANAGALSKRTLFAELKRRAILSGDVDYETEQEYIQEEGPVAPPEPPVPGNKPPAKKGPAA